MAELMNNDFGGLNYDRLGISKTAQDVMRFLFLGPDWTLSNVRSMYKTFSKDKIEANMHRKFWARVGVRGAALTVLINMIMAGLDDEDTMERTSKALKRGKFKWAMADISPLMHMSGGSKKHDYYFNVFGHFIDAGKFVADPLGSAYHKSSAVVKPFLNAGKGSDYAGRQYNSMFDAPGKGLKDWKNKSAKPITPVQAPSWLLDEMVGAAPIIGRSLYEFATGEKNGVQFIGESLGLDIKNTF